jgi:hypothetical protein
MEKNLTLKDNINALKWTGEVGLDTTIQLVIGMPGEDDETIHETTDFLKTVAPYILKWKDGTPSTEISINYAQALPGTPLYEWGRQAGSIGNTIDDEEQYLVDISDVDAYSHDHFVNHTGLPTLKILTWRPSMVAHLDAHHYRAQHGEDSGLSFLQVVWYYTRIFANRLYMLLKRSSTIIDDSGGYFNFSRGVKYAPLLLNPITKIMFQPLMLMALAIRRLKNPMLMFEYMRWSLTPPSSAMDKVDKSLRKIVAIVPSSIDHGADDKMLPLRKGR